jgi:DNA-binding XRE family transcriptional regulator
MLLLATSPLNIIAFSAKYNSFFRLKLTLVFCTNVMVSCLLHIAKEVKEMKTFDKEKVAVEFGAFVREARERQGMLQADVAEKLGVSRSYYTLIEAGKRDIYFATAVDICRILRLDFDEFVKRMK